MTNESMINQLVG